MDASPRKTSKTRRPAAELPPLLLQKHLPLPHQVLPLLQQHQQHPLDQQKLAVRSTSQQLKSPPPTLRNKHPRHSTNSHTLRSTHHTTATNSPRTPTNHTATHHPRHLRDTAIHHRTTHNQCKAAESLQHLDTKDHRLIAQSLIPHNKA